jgi:hypothetical protein
MNTPRVFAAAIAAGTLVLSAVQAQQARDQMQAPRVGTATISGSIVTDEATPQPLKRAQVIVMNPEAGFTKTVFTNEAGKFSLAGLPAGRYTLSANKAPFLRASYGARRYDRPGTPITLNEGAQITGVTLRMTRGSVLGGVITDENGVPAFGVPVRVLQVRVVNGERTYTNVGTGNSMNETTDDRGMYRFYGLPPGEYVVSATPRLGTGEVRAMTDAEIRAVMQALQQQTQAAQQARQNPGMPGVGVPLPAPTSKPETETVTVGYASVYYPGTTVAASAGTVAVGPSEERTGVDFPLRLVRTARIEGMVVPPAGIRPQSVQLMLTPGGSSSSAMGEMFTINRSPIDADGKFAFTAVPPGQYTIVARATAPQPGAPTPPPPPPPPGGGQTIQFQTIRVAPPGGGGGGEPIVVMPDMMGPQGGGPMYWGQADVSVDGTTLSGITVSMQPGMTIAGKIAFRGTRLVPDADLSRVRLLLANVPVQGGPRISTSLPQSVVEPNGQFRLTGVTPGRYRISGMAPLPPGSAPGPGWTLASAIVRGRDVLDFPLDVNPNDEINDAVITFTDATQEVSGSLQDAAGRPAPDFTIVVFSADARFWTTPSRRIRSTRPGTDGRFTVTNIPPGEYRIAALVDVAPGEINDPAFLEQIVGASVKFTLAEGEKKTQDLRIAGGL